MKKNIFISAMIILTLVLSSCGNNAANYEVLILKGHDEKDFMGINYVDDIFATSEIRQDNGAETEKSFFFEGKELNLVYRYTNQNLYTNYEYDQYFEYDNTNTISLSKCRNFLFNKNTDEFIGFINPENGTNEPLINKTMDDVEVLEISKNVAKKYWDINDYSHEKVEWQEDNGFLVAVSIQKTIYGLPSVEGCKIAFRLDGTLAFAIIHMKGGFDNIKNKINNIEVDNIIESEIRKNINSNASFVNCYAKDSFVAIKNNICYIVTNVEINILQNDKTVTYERIAYIKVD